MHAVRTWKNMTMTQNRCCYVFPRHTRHHTDLTTFHYVFNPFLAVLTSLWSLWYVPKQFKEVQIYSSLLHWQYVQYVWARSTRFYYILTTSTRLKSDHQRFLSKYIEHINDALLIWKSNFWLINMLYFSMEQMEMLSTLKMMNISFLWMMLEAEQQNKEIREQSE